MQTLHMLRETALQLIFDEKGYADHTSTGQPAVDRAVGAVRGQFKKVQSRIEELRKAAPDQDRLRRRGTLFLDLGAYLEASLDALRRMRAPAQKPTGPQGAPPEAEPDPKPQEAWMAARPWPALTRELRLCYAADRAAETTARRGLVQLPYEQQSVELVNAYRLLLGRPALAVNGLLLKAARGHSTEMREKGFFGHVSPTPGREYPHQRIAAEGYRTYSAGENVAAGPFDPQSAFEGWYRSPGHHRNLLREYYREIGVGVAGPRSGPLNASVKSWWTQSFGGGDLTQALAASTTPQKQ